MDRTLTVCVDMVVSGRALRRMEPPDLSTTNDIIVPRSRHILETGIDSSRHVIRSFGFGLSDEQCGNKGVKIYEVDHAGPAC